MCKHRISIFFAEILHGTLEYESTQTVKVPEGSESEGGKWIALTPSRWSLSDKIYTVLDEPINIIKNLVQLAWFQ